MDFAKISLPVTCTTRRKCHRKNSPEASLKTFEDFWSSVYGSAYLYLPKVYFGIAQVHQGFFVHSVLEFNLSFRYRYRPMHEKILMDIKVEVIFYLSVTRPSFYKTFNVFVCFGFQTDFRDNFSLKSDISSPSERNIRLLYFIRFLCLRFLLIYLLTEVTAIEQQ